MENALEMGKTSTTGGFQIFLGKVISTVLLAVGTVIVGMFILDADYGLYTIALIPATTFLLFQDWGVGSALTKYCAHCRATNKIGELRRIILAGLAFETATGLILSLISLSLATFIASTVFGKPQSAFLIALASITVFSTAFLATSQSIFVGFDRMGLSSLVTICQATLQGVLSPLLIYLGYGALGAVVGNTVSIFAAGIVGLAILYFAIFRKLAPDNTHKSTIRQTLRPLLVYGIPLAAASILGGILPQFYSFLMASVVDIATIGNYRIALNFTVLLTFFTAPIATVLFPAFSKLDQQNGKQLLKTVFASSVKYTNIFLVPATLAMVVLSKPIISTLYGNKWPDAPLFLAIYVVINLLAIFGNFSLGSFLMGLGKTKLMMKLSMLTLVVGVPLGFIMIPQLGIVGLIIATIIVGIPSMIIGLHWAWKHYGTKADFHASAKIFLASAIAAATTYLFLSVLNVASWILLASGIVLFLTIYLTAAPLVGAITQKDVYNLKAMFSGLGAISKILEIPLSFIQMLLNVRGNSKNLSSSTTETS